MSWIYPIVLILLIVAVMVFGRKSPVKGGDKLRKPMSFDDKENLRHTIKVNLSILDNELGELNAEIEAFSDFPEKDKLVPRLASAQQVVDDVMPVLDHISDDDELRKTLGTVFAAMTMTAEVRRAIIRKNAELGIGAERESES
ncbi:MAG: hypothetical protein H6677_03825 [Candidatus Obscuribacterales bacterium]|nr:hypothetical protein [Cyanobacteria bacterium HKST-UBA01]MCB9467382.1 hypothetical protein [Candidatus Obscuribacterales bacterium]